ELFTHLRFWPQITVRANAGDHPAGTGKRIRRAWVSAQKYSLVANSVKSEIIIEPTITVTSDQ
ncbi:MAG: hypothetical protein KDH90_23305, partial [Anaerolineae bacterium]|nr:hypothetical protein [Anaerolineae bacterium]